MKKISKAKAKKRWSFGFVLASLTLGSAVWASLRASLLSGDLIAPDILTEALATSYRTKGSSPIIDRAEKVNVPLINDLGPCRSLEGAASTATIDEEFMFWWEGQPKLCSLIRKLKGVSRIQDPGSPVLLNLAVNCTDLKVNNGLGTGNWLVAFYMVRLAAAFSSSHLKFQCTAGDYKNEILPYLQGCYPPNTHQWPPNNATEDLLCDDEMRTAPVHYAALEIREAMRHLVQEVTGFQRPPLSKPVNTKMFGEVVFDEVAIHFRCGDVLNLTNPRGDYGFTRYPEFKKRISQSARSIGIVTQSFDKSRNRERDSKYTDDCRKLVVVLVEKLRDDFPTATTTIRNGPGETITLAYARLAVAEQTIIGLSSFGAFPILADYGTSYFELGRLLVNKWLNFVPEIMNSMVVMKNSDFLRNRMVMKKGINFTLDWFAG